MGHSQILDLFLDGHMLCVCVCTVDIRHVMYIPAAHNYHERLKPQLDLWTWITVCAHPVSPGNPLYY